MSVTEFMQLTSSVDNSLTHETDSSDFKNNCYKNYSGDPSTVYCKTAIIKKCSTTERSKAVMSVLFL